MFKVKCINDKWGNDPDIIDAPRPVFNNDYTVMETLNVYGKDYHVLAECGSEFLYEAAFFAILPEPDADEMKEEEFEAIVNLETA